MVNASNINLTAMPGGFLMLVCQKLNYFCLLISPWYRKKEPILSTAAMTTTSQ